MYTCVVTNNVPDRHTHLPTMLHIDIHTCSYRQCFTHTLTNNVPFCRPSREPGTTRDPDRSTQTEPVLMWIGQQQATVEHSQFTPMSATHTLRMVRPGVWWWGEASSHVDCARFQGWHINSNWYPKPSAGNGCFYCVLQNDRWCDGSGVVMVM